MPGEDRAGKRHAGGAASAGGSAATVDRAGMPCGHRTVAGAGEAARREHQPGLRQLFQAAVVQWSGLRPGRADRAPAARAGPGDVLEAR